MKVNAADVNRFVGDKDKGIKKTGAENAKTRETSKTSPAVITDVSRQANAQAFAGSSRKIDQSGAESLLDNIKKALAGSGSVIEGIFGDINRTNAFALLKE